jgi:hypothetical protein
MKDRARRDTCVADEDAETMPKHLRWHTPSLGCAYGVFKRTL